MCVCVCCCVDSSSIACSWITFLPVCLISFPSSAGLDFLPWELGLFEEAYWACSPEDCQDQPWPTNTSEGSKLAGPNISSITEQTLWGLHSQGAKGHQLPNARRGEERSCSHARSTNARTHVSTCTPNPAAWTFTYMYARTHRQKHQAHTCTPCSVCSVC